MKILTVRQPYAHALIHLGKDVENRGRRTDYRGDVAIHAGLTLDPAGEHWGHGSALLDGVELEELPLGVIIGVATLTDVLRGVESPWAAPDQWHWTFSAARPLAVPIRWRGVRALVDLPDDTAAAVMNGLAA